MTAIELAPEGTGYRARTRFAKFFNLPELMAMSDRILVMKDGHVSGEIRKEDVSETLIMKYALKSEGEE